MASRVTAREVALLVWAYLEKNGYPQTAKAFKEEEAYLLRDASQQTIRQAIELPVLVSEYTRLKEAERAHNQFLEHFGRRGIAKRQLEALWNVLEDASAPSAAVEPERQAERPPERSRKQRKSDHPRRVQPVEELGESMAASINTTQDLDVQSIASSIPHLMWLLDNAGIHS